MLHKDWETVTILMTTFCWWQCYVVDNVMLMAWWWWLDAVRDRRLVQKRPPCRWIKYCHRHHMTGTSITHIAMHRYNLQKTVNQAQSNSIVCPAGPYNRVWQTLVWNRFEWLSFKKAEIDVKFFRILKMLYSSSAFKCWLMKTFWISLL